MPRAAGISATNPCKKLRMESYPPTTFHHGRYLTEAEMCLSKLFEKKHHERAEELQAKRKEREIMAQRSLSLQQVG
jgi:hypothetical protein